MCGIAGLINFDREPVSPVILKKMTDAIHHRGPDAEGLWIEDNVGIGHRRLSIIDLSPAGNQPMISADHRWVLSYNGEIYNYRELRIELEADGIWFRGQSDSEVVLYALARWGVAALLRFNGMFGLALWDREERTLLLSRDRYGIKPLYYSRQGKALAFGSEQKAILAHPHFQKRLNKAALLEYLTFQNILTESTLLEDINLLKPGHYAVFSDRHKSFEISQYWDYCFDAPKCPASKQEYVEELDRLFKQAVNRQLVGDVELGAYLSGGMDSGSVVATTAKQLPYIKTFTCGFDLSSASGIELNYDERAKAEAMSAIFKTEHYEMVLKAGDMERCFSKLIWHLEEPRVGQSYPNYYAAQLSSKFVKVVLSGTGGDELFAGYPWRYYRAAGSQSFESYVDSYYMYWQRLVSNSELKALFEPIWKDVSNVNTREIFRSVFSRREQALQRPQDCINASLYFECKTFLHGLFVVEDKLSMAHSLESRVPFMDNDLVEFAMRCPIELKLSNLSRAASVNENDVGRKSDSYFSKTNDGKLILREVMSRYIPETVTSAVKQGFSSPDASWFKGESIRFVSDRLLDKHSPLYEILSFKAVSAALNEHFQGNINRRLLIWSLLSVDEYVRQHSL